MVCQGCGAEMMKEARFCCHCGKPMALQTAWNTGWAPPTRLTRPRYGRMIGGVCAGIAQAYGFDPVLVRLLAVVLLFAGCGSLLIAYIVAWVIMPNGPYWFMTPTATGYAGGMPPPSGATSI